MSTSGMHRRPFEGRHLVFVSFIRRANNSSFVCSWICMSAFFRALYDYSLRTDAGIFIVISGGNADNT